MTEHVVHVSERSVAVHESGDPAGTPLIHFHGTPGSRLEADFGSPLAERAGVRVIGFDRPGYGRSDAGPISQDGIVRDVRAIADHLGVERFAVSAWSGGAAFALAAAAALPDRVTRAGVSGGLAPFERMPGARDALNPNDLEALSHLPADPARAAALFTAGNSGFLDAMLSVRDDEAAPWIDWMWASSDAAVIADPAARRALFANFHEALRQGTDAIAWDNVAFVGPWDFRVEDVRAPVHLWYGDRDEIAPPVNGRWLAGHLREAHLTVYAGEGHLLPLAHWAEMLRVLTSAG
ncbi:alpha/beta hydrolase [Rhodococcus sp. IEGM 1408]|uniref:alpha/beta fold hydrolase n=1 Tax=Rhodococcus sp. IEGM 1408 TaxID=3082220 RepID=UPI0029530255|nr:alpha/beta hydrolase [Rhodococcus sp. IEGM 1408]MDV7999937.1 alpha/beta hydrolase [Rhodococcus sp. IEGM 1408]